MIKKNQKDIISVIHKDTGIDKGVIYTVIELMKEYIIDNVSKKKTVQLQNFGNFSVKIMKPKNIRSINTGEMKKTKKTKRLAFKQSEGVKKKLQ